MNPHEPVPAFLQDDLAPAPPDRAGFHVIPAPLEQTVSYGGGTRRGPAAILRASVQLEAWLKGSIPGRCGIHTAPEVPCEGRDIQGVLADAGAAAVAAVDAGACPVLLGGEHTVTLGPVRALAEAGYEIGVVQIDAHADLRHTYQGSRFSHACVMRRIAELGIPFYQVGVRSLSAEEAAFRADTGVPYADAEEICRRGPAAIRLPEDFPRQVYLTFDVDGLDPSLMPATGTPEPGGLGWYAAIDAVDRTLAGRTLLAADVVELAPIPGWHAADFTAAKLVYEIMRRQQAAPPPGRPPC